VPAGISRLEALCFPSREAVDDRRLSPQRIDPGGDELAAALEPPTADRTASVVTRSLSVSSGIKQLRQTTFKVSGSIPKPTPAGPWHRSQVGVSRVDMVPFKLSATLSERGEGSTRRTRYFRHRRRGRLPPHSKLLAPYSRSPAASRASLGSSRKFSKRTIWPSRISASQPAGWSNVIPLSLPCIRTWPSATT
jgi:hypothetical protein